MSLMPRCRLTMDWLRSPSGATIATTTPYSAALEMVQGWMKWTTITAETRMAATAPPISPSQLLFGTDGGRQLVTPHGGAHEQ